jgi:hypothetical protein
MKNEGDESRFVDAAFGSLSPVEPSARLLRRVAEVPARHPRASGFGWPFHSAWRPLLGAVLVTSLGITTGMATFDEASSTTDVTSTVAAPADGSADDGWNDVVDAAWGESPALDVVTLSTP